MKSYNYYSFMNNKNQLLAILMINNQKENFDNASAICLPYITKEKSQIISYYLPIELMPDCLVNYVEQVAQEDNLPAWLLIQDYYNKPLANLDHNKLEDWLPLDIIEEDY